MHYEVVTRALAYASCISTMSLVLTSAAIIALNVGHFRPQPYCAPLACSAGVSAASEVGRSKAQIDPAALKLWSVKA